MPEGPEVATFADDLNRLLKGKKFIDLEYDTNFTHFKNINKIKKCLRIDRVCSHGKKIIFHFTNDTFLLSFLGLEGSWFQSCENIELDNLILFKMKFDDFYLCYKDTRHFGSIEYIEDYDILFTRLDVGIDILNGEDSFEDWGRVIKEAIRRHRNPLKVCEFLLEQRYVLGIGNYLRAEILYYANIDPFKEINVLTDEEIEHLRTSASREIRAAYSARGASLRTYKDLQGERGNYQTKIYGQKTSPDGKKIVNKKDKNGRTIWYVSV